MRGGAKGGATPTATHGTGNDHTRRDHAPMQAKENYATRNMQWRRPRESLERRSSLTLPRWGVWEGGGTRKHHHRVLQQRSSTLTWNASHAASASKLNGVELVEVHLLFSGTWRHASTGERGGVRRQQQHPWVNKNNKNEKRGHTHHTHPPPPLRSKEPESQPSNSHAN
jgi:hypothetical protein